MGPTLYMWYVVKQCMTVQDVLSAFLEPVWMAQNILLPPWDSITIPSSL